MQSSRGEFDLPVWIDQLPGLWTLQRCCWAQLEGFLCLFPIAGSSPWTSDLDSKAALAVPVSSAIDCWAPSGLAFCFGSDASDVGCSKLVSSWAVMILAPVGGQTSVTPLRGFLFSQALLPPCSLCWFCHDHDPEDPGTLPSNGHL